MHAGFLHKGLIVVSVLFMMSASVGSLSAQSLPFSGLSEAEISALLKGERVFSVLDSYSDLRIPKGIPLAKELEAKAKKVKPNFLAEVIIAVPKNAKPGLLDYMYTSLSDVEGFKNIPYYSKRSKDWFLLFDEVKIKRETSPNPNSRDVFTEQVMEPFERYETKYEYRKSATGFSFISENLTPLVFDGFRAVSPGNMITYLIAFEYGDYVIVYGIGGAKAFKFFGLFGDRLDTAFIGRVEAFFTWYYDTYMKPIL